MTKKHLEILKVTVDDGKYTIVQYDNGQVIVYRYGFKWRDCTGDGLILALAQEINKIQEEKNDY